MKPSLQPVFGINQTGAVFPRTSNPQPVQPNLTLRAATPGYKVLCDTNRRTERHVWNNAYWLYGTLITIPVIYKVTAYVSVYL